MLLDHYFNFENRPGISGLFSACGSFGIIDGKEPFTREEREKETIFRYSTALLELTATFTELENGVMLRKDTLLAKEPLEINNLLSRFCMDGNAYEVYTQYNGWV